MNLTSCQLQQMNLETWSCSQEGGADQGRYNDVIDTLINAVFEERVHVVVDQRNGSTSNPACLFVWQNISRHLPARPWRPISLQWKQRWKYVLATKSMFHRIMHNLLFNLTTHTTVRLIHCLSSLVLQPSLLIAYGNTHHSNYKRSKTGVETVRDPRISLASMLHSIMLNSLFEYHVCMWSTDPLFKSSLLIAYGNPSLC